jgi:uncharacterized protein DUF1566
MKIKTIFTFILLIPFLLFMIGCSHSSSAPSSGTWADVHGAGCQRSDPKSASVSDQTYAYNGYYSSLAPQGDAVRISNFVRMVRDATTGSETYKIVDTNQTTYFNNTETITAPENSTDTFYGQDAHFTGNEPSYTPSGDGKTVTDNVTELIWMKGPNSDLTTPVASDKMSISEASAYVIQMNADSYGGYSDWRIPTIKELYSLIIFDGVDVNGYEDDDTSGLIPFIDNSAFNFAYGDTSSNERIIDSQYLSSNMYVYTGSETLCFGVNFADGRIKGYGTILMGQDKTFFVQLVRGNTSYGVNSFVDNGDSTVTDSATGLMWTQEDSLVGMNWQEALAWVQEKNTANYLGYSNWRLPDIKELQSIVDYSHSPDYDGKPAIDTTYFNSTAITSENNETDYPWYWSGTTHQSWLVDGSGAAAAYVSFGRAMGYSSTSTMSGPPPM